MDRLLDALVNRAPELAFAAWAIWYVGGKIDALTNSLCSLNEKMARVLERVGL